MSCIAAASKISPVIIQKEIISHLLQFLYAKLAINPSKVLNITPTDTTICLVV
ncbi:hypothetical protein [Archaeoglobus sp.]